MSMLTTTLTQGNFLTFISVFGAGILTSLTPCVYPMIPITVSIFGAREATSKGSAFLLATAYVMGIALMYTSLGVLAALGGWAAGSILSSKWFVVLLSLFFIALATSMFGLWEIRLPYRLQNKMAGVGGKGALGAFLLGLVGGILIAPCTGPVLAGILTYVAASRNIMMGGALLFTYAMGIGVLFWVIATFAVALPKSGPWMESVKSLLGIALFVAAFYYLQNAFLALAHYTSNNWSFAALNGGIMVLGLVSGGIHLTFHRGIFHGLRKAAGILLLTIGAFGLVNYAMTPKKKLPWIYDEHAAIATAQQKHRPMLVDFWATYCTPCKLMEAQILSHPVVRKELTRFVLFKVDVSEDTERDQKLREKYRAPAELPLLVFIGSDGKEQARTGKVESVSQMLDLVRRVK